MTEVALLLPKLDGHTTEKLAVTFLGAVELDRTMDPDLELLNELRLGQDVQLVIVARCVSKGFNTVTKHDDSDVATYAVKMRVREVARVA